jgi:prepilin-type processing-associated H-X9-DG protein
MPIQFTCPHCGAETNVSAEFAGRSGPCAQCGQTVTVPLFSPPPGYAAPAKSPSASPLLVILAVVGGMILVIAVIGILIALLVPAVHASREAARQAMCANHLKQIGLALAAYQEAHGCLPPACITDETGKPMHSWRVLILPFLDQKALYDLYDFDEPWDSPNNRMVTNTPLVFFQCPSAGQTNRPETNYVMIVGPETIAYENSAVRVSDITDGASNTIMVVETAEPGIHWAEPRDLKFNELNLRINDGSGRGIGSRHSGRANVVFCDGSVRSLSNSTEPEMLRRLINRKDQMPIDRSNF